MKWDIDRQCDTILVLKDHEASMLLRLAQEHIRSERNLRDYVVKEAHDNPEFEDFQDEAADRVEYVNFLEHFISIAGDPEKGGVA